jgi:hypothetical protein
MIRTLFSPMKAPPIALVLALTIGGTASLTAQDSDESSDADPWADSQGWPGQESINREGGRTWWDTEKSDWPEWERGILRVGGMIADFDTSVSFSLNGAAGISINAEELLGLESQVNTFRADGAWRFGKRKRNTFDFTYAAYDRDATGTAERDIDLGDIGTIEAGARMDTVFNFDIIRGTYTYAFFQDKRIRLAAGLGVYVLPLEYGLTVTPLNGVPQGYDKTDSVLPLPALAFRGQYRITPKFYAYTDLDFMYLEIGDFSGQLVDLRLGVEYQIWRYFGLGLGYNVMDINVSASKANDYVGEFVGDIDVGFGGLMLYGKFSF